jgi:hypothetical protein
MDYVGFIFTYYDFYALWIMSILFTIYKLYNLYLFYKLYNLYLFLWTIYFLFAHIYNPKWLALLNLLDLWSCFNFWTPHYIALHISIYNTKEGRVTCQLDGGAIRA